MGKNNPENQEMKLPWRGTFAIWKPKGPSSYQMISEIKKITGAKKVGHAGTLDPLAEGILVVGIGREETKKLRGKVIAEKEYVAEIFLGATSATDDEEGEKTITQKQDFSKTDAHNSQGDLRDAPHILSCDRKKGYAGLKIETNGRRKGIGAAEPTRKEIGILLRRFEGKIAQTPPIYSAVKLGGKRAYRLARAGKKFELFPREVEIKKIEILDYCWPILKIRAVTGPGVYIRALARDIGKTLKTGGYLKSLVRTRVGSYTKETAVQLG